MIFVNKDRVASTSHNATGEDEQGFFWPEGTRFKLLQGGVADFFKAVKFYGRTLPKGAVVLEQVGAEEVRCVCKEQFFKEHFVREAEYAAAAQ